MKIDSRSLWLAVLMAMAAGPCRAEGVNGGAQEGECVARSAITDNGAVAALLIQRGDARDCIPAAMD